MKWSYRLLLLFIMLTAGYHIYVRVNGLIVSGDPIKILEHQVNKGKWESVKLYAEFILKYPEFGDTVRAREYYQLAEKKISEKKSLPGRVKLFLKGMVTGEPEDIESFLGSLTLDLFVIGDIRDLIIQTLYKPIIKREKPDILITALAGIGITTTYIPQLDIGVSATKIFARLKVFTKRFSRILREIARESVKARKFGKLKDIVLDIGRITGKIGIAPSADMVKFVDNPRELKLLSRAVDKNSVETYGLVETTNGKALKVIKSEEDVPKMVNRLRKVQRLGKIAKISRLLKIINKFYMIIPSWLLVLVLFLSFMLFIFSFRGKRSAVSQV